MGDPISKEELNAILQVTEKSTSQLVLITTSLQYITKTAEATLAKLSNGLTTEIKDEVCSTIKQENEIIFLKLNGIITKQAEIITSLNAIKKDALWVKILFGAITVLIVIGTFLFNILKHFSG